MTNTARLQRNALIGPWVDPDHICEDAASGPRDDRPGLAAAVMALRSGDTLVIWKLDRLGRELRHLMNTVSDLTKRGIGGRRLRMTPAKLRLAQATMGKPETKVGELCTELGVTGKPSTGMTLLTDQSGPMGRDCSTGRLLGATCPAHRRQSIN